MAIRGVILPLIVRLPGLRMVMLVIMLTGLHLAVIMARGWRWLMHHGMEGHLIH